MTDQPYGSGSYWLGLVLLVLMGGYFYCYSTLIERIKVSHLVVWASLGQPTPMDSNISPSFLRVSGFILHLQFLKVQDRTVKGLGFILFTCDLALLAAVIVGLARS